MSHAPHHMSPTYDERQVLFDECPECEWRGLHPAEAIGHMDRATFQRAWERAVGWQTSRDPGAYNVSSAEAPLLRVLFSVAVAFQLRGRAMTELPDEGHGTVSGYTRELDRAWAKGEPVWWTPAVGTEMAGAAAGKPVRVHLVNRTAGPTGPEYSMMEYPMIVPWYRLEVMR